MWVFVFVEFAEPRCAAFFHYELYLFMILMYLFKLETVEVEDNMFDFTLNKLSCQFIRNTSLKQMSACQ